MMEYILKTERKENRLWLCSQEKNQVAAPLLSICNVAGAPTADLSESPAAALFEVFPPAGAQQSGAGAVLGKWFLS